MKAIVRWRSSAARDFRKVALSYADAGGPALGLRFVQAAEATLSLLATMPNMGPPRKLKHGRVKEVRTWRVPGFENFRIYYEPLKDGIRVLRVIHAKMDTRNFLA